MIGITAPSSPDYCLAYVGGDRYPSLPQFETMMKTYKRNMEQLGMSTWLACVLATDASSLVVVYGGIVKMGKTSRSYFRKRA